MCKTGQGGKGSIKPPSKACVWNGLIKLAIMCYNRKINIPATIADTLIYKELRLSVLKGL